MSRKSGPLHAALMSLLVAACGTGAPVPTASAPATIAPPTRVPVTPGIAVTPQPTAASAQPSSVGVSCAGDDALWGLLPQPAQAYALAWISHEQAERLARLGEAMTEDGSYADPSTAERASGLPAIAERIGVFQETNEGHFLRVRAWEATDEHHDYVRVRWILCRQRDGRIVQEGEDILVLDETGLIREATRFTDS